MTGDEATGAPICVLLDFKREHYSALVKRRAEFGSLVAYLLTITDKDDVVISAPALTKALSNYITGTLRPTTKTT